MPGGEQPFGYFGLSLIETGASAQFGLMYCLTGDLGAEGR